MARASRKKSTRFAEALTRIRRERGRASAHELFRGGTKRLGISYHYYLLIEQGHRLPSPKVLRALLAVLGLDAPAHREQRRELLEAYARTLTGDDTLFDPVFDSRTPAPAPSGPDALEAAAVDRIRRVPRMTEEQYEAVNSSPLALWAFEWLLQTGRQCSLQELTRDLDCGAAELQVALDLLVSAKVLQRKANGKYSCKRSSTDLFGPSSGHSSGRSAWISEQVSRKTVPSEKAHFHPHFFLAAPDVEALAPAIEAFNQAMRKCYLLRGPVARGPAILVAVECRISPLSVSRKS